ncbi:nucleotidyltransferase domain-containing protein [Sphingomonas bacterium]|uniref:nucleotidyltransferase domain-containing protein n=1 Tax=Sphingomonas bacterium TaxID=1895847 RepID=UPI0015773CDB|nr:nucleotidyltransferase domain-containing protein [Sphingomonas bacterium]
MRLEPREVSAITSAAREMFGEGVVVRLFGSRRHDHRKGGDIDLHFEVPASIPDFYARSRFLDAIEMAIDGRKVDMLFSTSGDTLSGFEQIAYRDGLVL